MTRLALVLAAVTTLGTGCIVANDTHTLPPPGSLDIGWSFVRYKIVAGTPVQAATYSCATTTVAGPYLVQDVVVAFDGGPAQAVPCNDGVGDGARFDNLAPGPHTVAVSARQSIRGALVTTFTAQTSFSVASGQLTQISLLPLDGIPGDLEVWGGLYDAAGVTPFSCNPTVPTGTFTITDSVGTPVATASASCALAPTGNYELGVGYTGASALDLDVYTIRMTAASGAYDSMTKAFSPTCSGQAFAHASVNDTGTAAWFPKVYYVAGNSTFCP